MRHTKFYNPLFQKALNLARKNSLPIGDIEYKEFLNILDLYFDPYKLILLANYIPGNYTQINVFDVATIIPIPEKIEHKFTELNSIEYAELSLLLSNVDLENIKRIGSTKVKLGSNTYPLLYKESIVNYITYLRLLQPPINITEDMLLYVKPLNLYDRSLKFLCTASLVDLSEMFDLSLDLLKELYAHNTQVVNSPIGVNKIRWLGELLFLPNTIPIKEIERVTHTDPPLIPYKYKGKTYPNYNTVKKLKQYGLL